MNDESVADPCAECGGSCCSFRAMNISRTTLDPGERYDSYFLYSESAENLVFDDGSVPDMDWYIVTTPGGERRLSFECGHLTDDGKCGAYDKRPIMCREFVCPALDSDTDMTVDEFLSRHERPPNFPDAYDIEDVTDRVHEILRRRSNEEDWGNAADAE